VEHLQAQLWVFDRETKGMTQKNISYVPGFFKIFDEILVNAADNKVRTAPILQRHRSSAHLHLNGSC
jgi:DNA topoisomerase-2